MAGKTGTAISSTSKEIANRFGRRFVVTDCPPLWGGQFLFCLSRPATCFLDKSYGVAQPGVAVSTRWLEHLHAWVVPGARIELATPAFSGRRSTSELPRHVNNLQVGKTGRDGFVLVFNLRKRWLGAWFQQLRSLLQVALVSDVIPVENVARLVPGNHHCNFLRNAAANHAPYRRTPKIMHLQSFVVSGSLAVSMFLDQHLS